MTLAALKKIFSFELLLVILSLAVFGVCAGFDFLPYDDKVNIYQNRHLLEGDWLYFWLHSHVDLYIPVTYSVWLLIFKVFGMSPMAYHLTVLIFHILNVLLVFNIMSKLINTQEAAFIGALFFAIHPLQVESVAWATGLKDTLFLFLVLSSVFLGCFQKKSFKNQIFLGALAILAMLSKPTAAALPFFLFVVETTKVSYKSWIQRLRSVAANNKTIVVLMIAGAAILILSKISQEVGVSSQASIAWYEKFIVFFDSLGFYVKKIVIPTGLYPDYGRIPRYVIDENVYFTDVAIAFAFLTSLFLYFKNKIKDLKNPSNFPAVFAICFAVIFYLPTSGIVSFTYQNISSTADRYMYPILFAVAIFVASIYKRYVMDSSKREFKFLFFAVLLLFGLLSTMQLTNWKDELHFFIDMHEGNPRSYVATHNLGEVYQRQGRTEEALELFKNAHEIEPKKMLPLAGIVTIYFNAKNFSEMDAFGLKNLQPENLKQMTFNDESLMTIYKAYAVSFLERKNNSRALTFLCLADGLLTNPSSELSALIADTKASVPVSEQVCFKKLDELNKLF